MGGVTAVGSDVRGVVLGWLKLDQEASELFNSARR